VRGEQNRERTTIIVVDLVSFQLNGPDSLFLAFPFCRSREGGNPESLFFTNGGKEKDAGSPIKDVGDDKTVDVINECVTTDA